MEKKRGRIKIKDLNVDLEELKKRDPEVLKKIRGGAVLLSFQCQAGIKNPLPEMLTPRGCY